MSSSITNARGPKEVTSSWILRDPTTPARKLAQELALEVSDYIGYRQHIMAEWAWKHHVRLYHRGVSRLE